MKKPFTLTPFLPTWFTGRPPGEVREYTDEHGRRITVYPPGFADGVAPQQVGTRNQHLEAGDE